MVVTTGFDESAAIHPVKVDYGVARTDVVLSVRGEETAFSYPLVGRFNVSNIMTAFGVGLMLGIPAADIAKSLEDASPVPGRLERVRTPHDGGVSVYVDYAHTPDALEKALGSIMALGHGRTVVVFGCGIPFARHRNVSACARVQTVSGSKCVSSMPLTTPFSTPQRTAS